MDLTIFDRSYNYVNIFRENYRLTLGPNKSPDVLLGVGYDISELDYPIAKGLLLSGITELKDNDNLENESDPQSFQFKVSQALTIAEEMTKLSINFSGSYGLVKGSVSYETVKKSLEDTNIFYLELESFSGSSTIEDISAVDWKNTPIAEFVDDLNDRFKQFISDQGSHFVRTIYFGNRIVIRASTRDKESSFTEKLNIALKAVGSTFTASAELSQEHISTLKNSNVEISISILGKLVSTTDDNKNPIFGATSYEGLMRLISGIKDGEVKIISCPILCELETYRYRLTQLKKCMEIYEEVSKSEPANSPFGVPSGTVIAWIPKLSNCKLDDEGNVTEIVPPVGWIICDMNSDYKMEGTLLRGTSKFELVNSTGGQETHDHLVEGNVGPYQRTHRGPNGLDGGDDDFHHIHSLTIKCGPQSNLPPYYNVVFLIKI